MKLLRKVLAGTIVAALNITTCGSLRRSTSDPIILLVNRTTQPHRALPVNRDFFFLSPGRGRAVITTMTIVYICRDILFFLPQDLHVYFAPTVVSHPSDKCLDLHRDRLERAPSQRAMRCEAV